MAGRKLGGLNPLAYMGVKPTTPPELIISNRAPTAQDVLGYSIGTQWLWKNTATPDDSLQYVLVSVAENAAVWLALNEADTLILPDHSVALGTGVAGLNSVGPENAIGVPLISQGLLADPVFGTAEPIGGGTGWDTLQDHSVLVGAAQNPITFVAPMATVGAPLVSTGAASDPEFGVASVSGGGTGLDVVPQYAVVCGGITGEGPLQTVVGLGTATQVLTSQGLGNLPIWANPTGGVGGNGGPIAVQVFNTAGAHVYTPTATAASCFVEVVAGGGGGGGVGAPLAHAGGGGAGGYSRKFFLISGLGATENIVVGAGGAGGVGANPGVDGGDTTFGTVPLISAGGGQGAAAGAAGAQTDAGAGGPGVSGDLNVTGQNGGEGFASSDALVSGFGGSGIYGSGGIAVAVLNGGTHEPGDIGESFGAGGSGAVTGADLTANGGAGSSGLVIITEYGPYAPTPPADPVQINQIIFDTPGAGTYTPSAGMFQCIVEILGGGGGGGGIFGGASGSSVVFGGSSGSGGYCKKLFDDITIGASQNFVIGSGGTAGVGSTLTNGGNGGTTTFGTVPILTAGGGFGGITYQGLNNTYVIAAGGSATGGDINVIGQAAGVPLLAIGASPAMLGSGAAGSTLYGRGGATVMASGGFTSPASIATGYGSGGGAPAYFDQTGITKANTANGAAGASGVVIITEYIAI